MNLHFTERYIAPGVLVDEIGSKDETKVTLMCRYKSDTYWITVMKADVEANIKSVNIVSSNGINGGDVATLLLTNWDQVTEVFRLWFAHFKMEDLPHEA